MEPLGFIGLGTIGGIIAKNLRSAGYPLVVHDIRPEAAQPLVEAGAQRGQSAADVAQRCKIVLTSLPSPREVEAVALGAGGLIHGIGAGSLYVDLTSSHPDLIRRIGAAFQTRGAQVLDAPLIVGPKGIANKSVQILASGEPAAFATARPILEAFGDTLVYTGALGSGTIIKLAHNLVRRGIGLAIGEGIVLGAKAGADPELLWQCMHWGLDVQLQQMGKTLPATVFTGEFEKPSGFNIALARKDVGLATELGRQQNVPMPIAALVEQIMTHAIGRGWGRQSTLSLFRLQEEAAGVEVRKSK